MKKLIEKLFSSNIENSSRELPKYCENWPEVFEGYVNAKTGYLCDESDMLDGETYEKAYEPLDTENFDSRFEVDENGEDYLEVYAGGDWQDCHKFRIYKNKENSQFPFICKNIMSLGEDI